MATILSTANDVLIDLNGEIAYLENSKVWTYDATDTELIGSQVTFNDSDLGQPTLEKLINFADADYIGAFDLSFYFDGTFSHTMSFPTSATRTTADIDFPLAKRKAMTKIKLIVTATAKITKIYGLEIDFSLLRRRRYN